jgi:hypothetical protein
MVSQTKPSLDGQETRPRHGGVGRRERAGHGTWSRKQAARISTRCKAKCSLEAPIQPHPIGPFAIVVGELVAIGQIDCPHMLAP